MATSTNRLLSGVTGKIGPLSIRQRGGKTIVCLSQNTRKSNSKPTCRQTGMNERFKRGVMVAKALLNNPVMKQQYAKAASNGKSAYNVAVADALTPPAVTMIGVSDYKGLPGNTILIRAVDDFKVVSVKVSVYASDGKLIEDGNAIQTHNEMDWLYTALVENDLHKGSKIIATATDIPGNQGVSEVLL